jgi:phage tail-like protein
MMTKNNFSAENIRSRFVGLDLYKARKKIFHDFPELDEHQIDVHYEESDYPRFTILDCQYDEREKKIKLKVSSVNPIRHLPSNYQSNDFLRGFLMIFQHIMNDTALTLDNMHKYFRPMESPLSFLPVLTDWFGIPLDVFDGENEVRQFLQYAFPLYRFRGTAIGLKVYLSILTNIVPEIIEDKNPYEAMLIHEHTEIDTWFFENDKSENCFTIFFPVERNHFDDSLIQKISRVVQQEKPVYTKAYIAFKKEEKLKRKITLINEENSMDFNGIIFI